MEQTDETLDILSLGAGVQSSTIALMAAAGDIETFDAAIFANTGWEPKRVIKWLGWLKERLPFPVYEVRAGDRTLRDHIIDARVYESGGKKKRFVAIPYFTAEGGIGKRQCTSEFKITPIHRKVRDLSGLKPRQHAKYILANMNIGISLDEIQRMKPSRDKWLVNVFPLIDLRMTRHDCFAWLERNGYPEPPKSSCVGCPFHNDQMWANMKKEAPEEFADAIEIDNVIREIPGKGMKEFQFMHRSLKPLKDVEFRNERQVDMFGNECSGYCGT